MIPLHRLFRARGRITRGAFFLRVVLLLVAFALLDAALEPLLGAARVWLLNPLALWMLVAAGAQRLHDRDRSGWWQLAALVPILGVLWLLWQFVSRGAASDNRWGPDPKRETGDYLVVG